MARVTVQCAGFYLSMLFDPADPLDCEIMAEAFLLLHRRVKKCKDVRVSGNAGL